ncbi:MAG: YihA family ribosome biogenesis GTP-binding protein [Pseudomonadales bacterium]|nr:YihA family ribosome biogenesis GTP-binding protein [Pseudomonadales bacterium]
MRHRLDIGEAAFLTSAARFEQCPPDIGREVAFCGRSNAGKSSAINYLTGQNKLARTSKTPGRTQLINFFEIGEDLRLVDLPGYGYAKVPTAMREAWHRHIDAYLTGRQSLVGLVMVMDIRHPLKEFDESMVDWAADTGHHGHVVLTKCDKLKRGAQNTALLSVRRQLPEGITAQIFSATHDIGRDELTRVLSAWLVS